ncbi:MAG: 50S ribosomal protein L24 [Planctomycetes bacterium GWC2_49_10]|nr:MAG: 50S ribosomal protein L24 [Planctomycetes bacterium GWC2_49_10]
MAAHVKKGDLVQIIAGSGKGSTGKVLRVNPEKDVVVIEGHNRKWKHVKPSRKYPQGGRLQVERPIHISNVLPVNPKSSKGTRVRFETDKKGAKKRVALDGTELGVVVKK